MATNVSNIGIDSSGRVTFSGLASKIDTKAAIDAIIAAKRIPIGSLEKKIETNDLKVAAYQTFRGHLNALKESLSGLYGAITADRSKNIFEAKQAFASSSRTDGGAASSPADLVGVTVSNQAAAGSHTLEVVRTAASHRVGSGSLSSTSADLGTARGLGAGAISGSFTIKGVTINVSANDSVLGLATRINNANTGPNATGVSASVVRASATESYLVLNVDQSGTTLGSDVALADPDGVLEKLGVLRPAASGGGFANELQAAQTAQFHADGLTDPAQYRSAKQSSVTAALGSAGALSFTDANGAALGSIAYGAATTLEGLRDAINADAGLTGAGISASIVQDGSSYTLRIEDADGESFSISDSGGASAHLGLAKAPLLLERKSNTITDLFDGVTLSIFQAEPGTKIKIDVERNLSQVKSAIEGFVSAYNNVRQFLNAQLDTDPATGKPRAGADLFGSTTLSDAKARLSELVGGGTAGVSEAFAVLAQIGITYTSASAQQDPTLANTLKIDSAKLDKALLSNPLDVQKMFAFSLSSSDPSITAVGFDGRTGHKDGGYTIDIDYDEVGNSIVGATIDGQAATVSGRMITMQSGPAAGLRLFYNGSQDVTGGNLEVTAGTAARLFFELDSFLDSRTGTVETEIKNLTDQNKSAQTRVDEMLVRLDLRREALAAQFLRMETALSQMNSLLESVTQMTDAMFQKQR